ncbi:ImpA family metalloprotease [Microbulbifer halophilus]|uniref:ImpA family metalloprotease n=1 Tax=Microbulbifer halophilus TaxID=453963 RepID=A0ABW5EAW4_9GAMM
MFGVILVLGLLQGCGSGGDEKSDTAADGSEQTDNGNSGDDDNTGDGEKPAGADPLEQALIDGDSSALDNPQDLIDAALSEVARLRALRQQILEGFAVEDALAYPVPRSSHFIDALYGNGVPILRGSNRGRSLASAVQIEGARAAGIGFEFYVEETDSTGMDAFGSGLLRWLAGSHTPDAIALAGIERDGLNHWLARQLPDSRIAQCPGAADCLDGAGVLIVSDRPAEGGEGALKQLLQNAHQRGIGILYVHTRGWDATPLGRTLAAELGMALGDHPGNYFVQDPLDWPDIETMLAAMEEHNPIETALQNFRAESFPVDWNLCESEAGGDCDKDAALRAALLDGAAEMRDMLNSLDRQGRPLFRQRGQRLLKLLVLLGDLWRVEIRYPMQKESAAQIDFMRALFADYSVHYLRDIQSPQPDLGSFSAPLDGDPQAADGQVSLSVQGDHFTAIGAYIPPGQRITIRRSDKNPAATAVRINTQRTGSTRLWDEYSRPRFLASPAIPLAAGQSISLTSPYGGTLQLVYSGADDTQTIQLELQGAVQHPFLQYSDAMDESAFATALQYNPLSWAEIRSPFAEIHSLRERLNQSINDSRYGGSSQQFLEDLFEYMLRDAYALAGFQGGGVELAPLVELKCSALGWDCSNPQIHGLPEVQHINVDRFAHCGSGCSGNPYDQAWPLDPFGWGESHELGHNLQRNRLKIHGGRSAEVSCNLFPLHKNWRLLQEESTDRSSDRIAYRDTFETLKAGAADGADAYGVAYDAIWADDSYAADNGERMAFYAQLPQLWREVTGEASRGWNIYTLLYLAERQFSHISADDWTAERSKFGLDGFAEKPELNGNEFMLLMSSFLSGRDLRPLWDIWGVDYGSATAAQLDAWTLPPQDRVLWVGPDNNDWNRVEKVPVSADMAWPF